MLINYNWMMQLTESLNAATPLLWSPFFTPKNHHTLIKRRFGVSFSVCPTIPWTQIHPFPSPLFTFTSVILALSLVSPTTHHRWVPSLFSSYVCGYVQCFHYGSRIILRTRGIPNSLSLFTSQLDVPTQRLYSRGTSCTNITMTTLFLQNLVQYARVTTISFLSRGTSSS